MAELTEQTVRQIINSNIREQINKKSITDFLIHNLNDTQQSILLELLLSEYEYIPYKKGDMVFYKPDSYDLKEHGQEDTLTDLGLMHNECLAVKIIDSDNYGESFDPYHYKFKVNVLGHDDKGKVTYRQATIHSKNMMRIADPDAFDEIRAHFKSLDMLR